MKIKITLLLAQIDKKRSIADEGYFKIYLNNQNEFPSKLLYSKDEKETLKQISDNYFNIDFEWLKINIADFRVLDINGERIGEVVYITYVPEILGIIKSGKLVSESYLKEQNINIEDFYGQIFTKKAKFIA